MRRQIDNRTASTIISLIILAAITALLAQLVNFGSKELDRDVDELLFAIGVSVMGISFFLMRKMNLGRQSTESFEILFLVIIPVIAFIRISADPSMSFAFFFPVYYGGLIGWLLTSKHFIFDPIDTDEKRMSWSAIKRLWGFLMALSIPIFPLYFLLFHR